MCHHRDDWSRTSNRASEPDEESASDSERAWWGSRAKERLVTFVSPEQTDRTDEPPAKPTVEPEPEATTADPTESEIAAEEDEREEEPILADD